VDVLSWLRIRCATTSSCLDHAYWFTSLVSHGTKVNECFHDLVDMHKVNLEASQLRDVWST